MPVPVRDAQLRQDVISAALATIHLGLNRVKSGNVSARVPGGFVVTPSGVRYESLEPADLTVVRDDGSFDGPYPPSSEWRFHLDIYAERPEVAAIVHTHPPFGTAFACARRGIPAFHYMVAVGGGRDIRCAPYATFGTPELSENAIVALRDRKACLLANHGAIAVGGSVASALSLAHEVEGICEQYFRALQVGPVTYLDDIEMDRVIEKFKSYGPNFPPGARSLDEPPVTS